MSSSTADGAWPHSSTLRPSAPRPIRGEVPNSAAIAWSVTGENLLDQPETLLPAESEVLDALSRTGRHEIATVVAAHPTSSLAWAELADVTHAEGRSLESYAYARVGYHRGLDALRKAGWRGHGSIPWTHEPNRGVLRAIYALRRAAAEIGETGEFDRLTTFLDDSDPTAISRIESEHTTTQLMSIVAVGVGVSTGSTTGEGLTTGDSSTTEEESTTEEGSTKTGSTTDDVSTIDGEH